jgi:hypothetical protein
MKAQVRKIEVKGWGRYEVPRGWTLYVLPGGTKLKELAEQIEPDPLLLLGWRPGTLASPSEVLVATPRCLRFGCHPIWSSEEEEEEEED